MKRPRTESDPYIGFRLYFSTPKVDKVWERLEQDPMIEYVLNSWLDYTHQTVIIVRLKKKQRPTYFRRFPYFVHAEAETVSPPAEDEDSEDSEDYRERKAQNYWDLVKTEKEAKRKIANYLRKQEKIDRARLYMEIYYRRLDLEPPDLIKPPKAFVDYIEQHPEVYEEMFPKDWSSDSEDFDLEE